MPKIILTIFAIFLLFLTWPKISLAADYRTDYRVEYFLKQGGDDINTHAKFNISITNLQSENYVKKFTLSFPKSFIIKNLAAHDDLGSFEPSLFSDDRYIKIGLEFTEPATGRGSVNNITLEFDQDNLFKTNGNVWEVILPTIEKRDAGSYQVVVNLPADGNKKIAIAKPRPDLVRGNQIFWNNPTTKTIYAVFGDKQYYDLQLRYNLQNPNLSPVYTDVTFPPDTLYQRTFIDSIEPRPALTYTDSDGNYLGRYFLKPKERKTILYKGTTEIFSKPREDMVAITRALYLAQKPYLLSEQNYWRLSGLEKVKNLKTPQDIYSFVTKYLQYDYQKVLKNAKRLGANQVIRYPTQAVCTEFSDLFIAISREMGVPAREIQGFGFSNDTQLRPLSLLSDVLHSWPEYYDTKKDLWIPVDPTWENTSGIDYFSSFDLNHITFAIHGKRSDYPLPAGMYKTEDTKDVSVKATTANPKENFKITTESPIIPDQINDRESYKFDLTVVNEGNTFAWNVPVDVSGINLIIEPRMATIFSLVPYEKKVIPVEFRVRPGNLRASSSLKINVAGNEVDYKTIRIIPFYYDITLKAFYFILTVGTISTLIFFIRRRPTHG